MANKIGVNDDCPCGSNRKYKKCYLANSEHCALFLKEKYIRMNEENEKMTQEVTESLLRTTQDLNQLFYKTPEDIEIIPSLMQMIGIFTVVDVLGSYWYEYLGRTGKQSERFDDFINNFCFTDKNQEFVQRKYLGTVTAEELRDLRNSIVHFYGLGASHHFSIISNFSKTATEAQTDAAVKSFTKIRPDMVFIQPFELKRIVIEGAAVMLERFQADGGAAVTDIDKLAHIENVRRIHRKLKEEGAAIVSQEMAEKVTAALS